MTQAETKLFENDISMFPEKDKQEMPVNQEEVVEVRIRRLKIDVEKRFSRFRKNLRKRSVSIL